LPSHIFSGVEIMLLEIEEKGLPRWQVKNTYDGKIGRII
jgi:hypothetical protein